MGKTSARSDGKTTGDRKLDKKVQFYEKVRAAVVSKAISKETKQKKHSRQKKLKAYDLSSLTECLPELTTPTASEPAKLKLNCKRRNDLVLKESDKMKMVINHPVYQSDPLAAIHQHLELTHLELTQPAMEKKPKKKDGKTKKNKSNQRKVKAMELMDM